MLLPFYSQDKYLNVSKKKHMLSLISKMYNYEMLALFFLLSPLFFNFVYFLGIKGMNSIDLVFNIIYKYFSTGDDLYLILSLYNIFAWVMGIFFYSLRTILAVALKKEFLVFKEENPNFYNLFATYINLACFLPFYSVKLKSCTTFIASYKIPHTYSL